MAANKASQSLNLTITNPLVLYRALLSTKRIKPDPAQHRLALQLQQLYFRLKDYQPEVEFRYRLDKVAKLNRRQNGSSASSPTTAAAEALSKNQQRQAVFDDNPKSSLSRFFGRDDLSRLAITRTIPIHSSAMSIDSPQGMLLYGEVGRGKSMLIDLLYDSLPTTKKRRWHFNTFMLDIFRRLETARIERSLDQGSASGFGLTDHEHVVLSLARETMEKSPILFLDEFQLPDRVAGKLVNGFLMSFFHLGGVLVASSNRMPEELAKAQGIEFASMGKGSDNSVLGQFLREKFNEGQKAARGDFGVFVEVLKTRCEVWEMEGERDWRRDDDENSDLVAEGIDVDDFDFVPAPSGREISDDTSAMSLEKPTLLSSDAPPHYHVSETSSTPTIPVSFTDDILKLNPSNAWTPTTLTVYARSLTLPTTSPDHGVALLPFPQICMANLGPADYISLCSTFHTLIITQIPVLTLLQKNEARRFITLLDACYEARCRLLIEAAAPPDRLFFPETRMSRGTGALPDVDRSGDSIDSEAFSEMYQDSTAPFRPNVSAYGPDTSASPTPSLYRSDLRSVLADEDADFGPTYGNGRGHGPSSSTSPYSSPDSSSLTNTNNYIDPELEIDMPGRPLGFAELEKRQGPDFTQTGALTGEDERFAYKRARSRLWEMCGRKWWERREGRDPSEWWTPVRREGRFWEKVRELERASVSASELVDEAVINEVRRSSLDVNRADGTDTKGGSAGVSGSGSTNRSKDADAMFRHGASPFRRSAEPPPKFGWQHAWGMMKWGKKAGEWGKGVEGERPGNRRGEDVSKREEEGK